MTSFEEKIIPIDGLSAALLALPRPIVMTNGVFDLLHRGHVAYLEKARALGASLLVSVNTDASVRRLGKDKHRPLNTCADRMAVLAALQSVSAVLAFAEDTALAAVLAVRPDIYVKGADYDLSQTPEGRAVLGYGGQVRVIPLVEGRSTTALVNQIRLNLQP